MDESASVLLVGVGDIHVERPDGESIFSHVRPYLQGADLVFANSEQLYSGAGAPAKPHPCSRRADGADMAAASGFDVISFANNHSMDWGPDCLLDTLVQMRRAGIHPVGAGANIAAARAPEILTRNGIKVAFLAYACTGPLSYAAEEDKVGYAPVHATTTYEQVDYQPGTPPLIRSQPIPEQLAAMEHDIASAKQQCDAVVVSFHWGIHFVPAEIPEYCAIVGRAAVDAGASLILGTHAHMLKGIELYKGVPIFYGTGNFAFELGMSEDNKEHIHEMVDRIRDHYGFELDPEYPYFPMHPDSRFSFMVEADISRAGVTGCRIIPCLINPRCEPVPAAAGSPEAARVLDYLERITREARLNTSFTRVDDMRLAVTCSADSVDLVLAGR